MEKYIFFSEFSTQLKVQEFLNEGAERGYRVVSLSSYWVSKDPSVLRVQGVSPIHYDIIMELKD